MTSVQAAVPPAPPHPDDDWSVQERAVVEWGLGWEIKGATRGHHTGDLTSARTFSHLGASGTMMWADPDAELGCVLLTNRALSSGWAAAPARHARFSNAVAAALVG
jgi:CubicO group peptidase (beta-lactamase class C family)